MHADLIRAVLKGAADLGNPDLPCVPRFVITTTPHQPVARAISQGQVVVRRLS
jgi:hypothetical protein